MSDEQMLSRKVLELEIEVEALKSALLAQWDCAHARICGRIDCVSCGGDAPCVHAKPTMLKGRMHYGD